MAWSWRALGHFGNKILLLGCSGPGAGVSNTVHGLYKTGTTEFLTHLQREEKSKKIKQLNFLNVRHCH